MACGLGRRSFRILAVCSIAMGSQVASVVVRCVQSSPSGSAKALLGSPSPTARLHWVDPKP